MQLSVETKQVQSQAVSQQMQQALFLLPKNAWELNEYVREQALENPMLEVREPQWQERELYPGTAYRQMEWEKPASGTLAERLAEQLDFGRLDAGSLRAAKEIIAALDSRGYFVEPLADIAKLCRVSDAQAARALAAVQALEPAGVGARSLSECLCLQLERCGQKDEALYRIARDYLDELARGKYAEIASALGISAAKAKKYCAFLRSLKPGVSNVTQEAAAQYVCPEIVVEKDGDMLRVYLDERRLIRPAVDASYQIDGADSRAAAYLRERRIAAKRLVQSVDLWKTMLRRTAEKIVLAQSGYFLNGAALEPLKMADIADGLGVHVSTVSRAVAGKHLIYDMEVLPLKKLFSRGITGAEKQVSGDYIKRNIRKLLAAEPGLPDNAVAERIKSCGIEIARRTVAKYRREMGIASSYRRNKEKI